jgi:hypothetical protein
MFGLHATVMAEWESTGKSYVGMITGVTVGPPVRYTVKFSDGDVQEDIPADKIELIPAKRKRQPPKPNDDDGINYEAELRARLVDMPAATPASPTAPIPPPASAASPAPTPASTPASPAALASPEAVPTLGPEDTSDNPLHPKAKKRRKKGGISNMNTTELRDALRALGEPDDGNKKTLGARLKRLRLGSTTSVAGGATTEEVDTSTDGKSDEAELEEDDGKSDDLELDEDAELELYDDSGDDHELKVYVGTGARYNGKSWSSRTDTFHDPRMRTLKKSDIFPAESGDNTTAWHTVMNFIWDAMDDRDWFAEGKPGYFNNETHSPVLFYAPPNGKTSMLPFRDTRDLEDMWQCHVDSNCSTLHIGIRYEKDTASKSESEEVDVQQLNAHGWPVGEVRAAIVTVGVAQTTDAHGTTYVQTDVTPHVLMLLAAEMPDDALAMSNKDAFIKQTQLAVHKAALTAGIDVPPLEVGEGSKMLGMFITCAGGSKGSRECRAVTSILDCEAKKIARNSSLHSVHYDCLLQWSIPKNGARQGVIPVGYLTGEDSEQQQHDYVHLRVRSVRVHFQHHPLFLHSLSPTLCLAGRKESADCFNCQRCRRTQLSFKGFSRDSPLHGHLVSHGFRAFPVTKIGHTLMQMYATGRTTRTSTCHTAEAPGHAATRRHTHFCGQSTRWARLTHPRCAASARPDTTRPDRN